MKKIWALGLMSGTSLDGIDGAYVQTDGVEIYTFGPVLHHVYPKTFRQKLAASFGARVLDPALSALEQELTDRHNQLCQELIEKAGFKPDVIGFHGQTITHDPAGQFSWQLGGWRQLARQTGVTVVGDFRRRDIEAGGQGAPLAPVFHTALSRAAKGNNIDGFLNIGGISNLTVVSGTEDSVLAFDCGPGNGWIDDWVKAHKDQTADWDGQFARRGKIDSALVEAWLQQPFFSSPWPKSLDRLDLATPGLEKLSLVDGAASLTAFSAQSVALAFDQLRAEGNFVPDHLWVTGGGRHNPVLMEQLTRLIPCPVQPIENLHLEGLKLDGDFIEAQAFAYMAVRRLYDLASSFPGTTGVTKPTLAGDIFIQSDV